MTDSRRTRSVCLVGAGNISHIHAEALKSLSVPIAAVVDPNPVARQKLARQWQVPANFGTIDEALATGAFGRAHVLVPPDFHAAVAGSLLRVGLCVLVEKPLATTAEACSGLVAATQSSACLGVNQNFVHRRTAVGVEGNCCNIVGGVRPSAREYIAQLETLKRPLRCHGKNPYGLYSNELMKWGIKLVGGRETPPPSLRDILSCGLKGSFDRGDAKADLHREPNADTAKFYEQAF